MKKRLFTLAIFLLLLLTGLRMDANAAEAVASGTCGGEDDGGNVTWTLDSEGTLTISGAGKMKDYTTKTSPWYDERGRIKTLVLENGVTSIGDYAFWDCRGLTSVTIPDSVTSIREASFSDCTGLTSAGPIGSGCDYEFGWTEEIPRNAFQGFTGLKSVTIPASVTFIGQGAFYGCTGLTSAGPLGSDCNIKFGWTQQIPKYAFYHCTLLTSVTVPDSVTSIGEYAFEGCRGLKSVTIPASVTSIRNNAFEGCRGLKSVTIPASVNSIGEDAFQHCTGLTSAGPIGSDCNIEFGWTEQIPEYAFYHCTELTSVKIPDSVTSIGWDAFYGCTGLTSASIPDSVTSIGGGGVL